MLKKGFLNFNYPQNLTMLGFEKASRMDKDTMLSLELPQSWKSALNGNMKIDNRKEAFWYIQKVLGALV